jgi:hypothetical protein
MDMHFKDLLIILVASMTFAIAGYLLFAERLKAAGASGFVIASAIFLLIVLNVDVISSFAASWGEYVQIRVDINRLKEDVFAKVEYVRRLGEEVARFASHNVATANRFVGEDHQVQMLQERERIRALMTSLGSDERKIAETLSEIDRTILSDLKGRVVAAVGKINKHPQAQYVLLVQNLRDRLRLYDSPASHGDLVEFLEEQKSL